MENRFTDTVVSKQFKANMLLKFQLLESKRARYNMIMKYKYIKKRKNCNIHLYHNLLKYPKKFLLLRNPGLRQFYLWDTSVMLWHHRGMKTAAIAFN